MLRCEPQFFVTTPPCSGQCCSVSHDHIDCPNSGQFRLDRVGNQTAARQTRLDKPAAGLDLTKELPKPRDCSKLLPGTTKGVHPIWPDPSEPPPALCQQDTDGGERLTVFQRRDDIQPHQDFYLGWDGYVKKTLTAERDRLCSNGEMTSSPSRTSTWGGMAKHRASETSPENLGGDWNISIN